MTYLNWCGDFDSVPQMRKLRLQKLGAVNTSRTDEEEGCMFVFLLYVGDIIRM
jgi:hypothetical protein